MMNTTTKKRCCETIWGPRVNSWQCPRFGTVERGGKWYCKQHDPEAVKARRKAASDKYDAKYSKETATRNLWYSAADSYRKHCGESALALAEEDLLGQALELLKSWEEAAESIQLFEDLECFYDDPSTSEEYRTEYQKRSRTRAILSKLPSAPEPPQTPSDAQEGPQRAQEGVL